MSLIKVNQSQGQRTACAPASLQKATPVKVRGFTLVELIMVVAVIIIIALIAIPNFAKSKRKGISKEGLANMKVIGAAEIIRKMETGAYLACSGGTCNSAFRLVSNATNWAYSVAAWGTYT